MSGICADQHPRGVLPLECPDVRGELHSTAALSV